MTPATAAVHSIDHFALNVPDLDEATRFVTAFGLRAEAVGGGLALRADDDEHVWARLTEGPGKRLRYLALGCAASDLASLQARAETARVPAPANAAPGGFWLRDPDGNLLQVTAARNTQPRAKAPLPDGTVPAGTRGVGNRAALRAVRPVRLSHVLLFTPDVARMVDFYASVLGLRLSDRSADIIAFMHAVHGCDHHLVAFAKSPAPGFHHSSWDVPRIDDVGAGAMQMRRAGYAEQWGVGRHVLGSNYFDYVRDRSGAWWEYSCHIDYVPAGTVWEAADHPPEDSLYLWGADVPPTFIQNTEAGG